MSLNKANPRTPHISRDDKGLWTCAGGEFLVIGYGYCWRDAAEEWKAERKRRIQRATGGGAPLTFNLGCAPVEQSHV
jgi:hypothetical protein